MAPIGVNGEDGWLQFRERLDCFRNGVGNVVQLEVEKDREA